MRGVIFDINYCACEIYITDVSAYSCIIFASLHAWIMLYIFI